MSPDQPSHSSGINSGVVVVAALGLVLILAIVFLFPLYARCVLRRQTRSLLRRQIMARRAELAQIQVVSGVPKAGLDAAAITALPIFAYRKGDGAAAAECAVCLGGLQEEEMVRSLPNCMHTFHAQCIDLWLGSHSTCPICRMEAMGFELEY